jgi:hypothetical protein
LKIIIGMTGVSIYHFGGYCQNNSSSAANTIAKTTDPLNR